MIQVRNGVFETNSSSSHSIVILKNKKFNKNFDDNEIKSDFWLDSDGNASVFERSNDFGRFPFHVISSFKEKVLYCIAYYCGSYNSRDDSKDKYREIIEIVRKHVDQFQDFRWPLVSYWGEDESISKEEIDYGSVDHQSIETLRRFIYSEDISLEEFLLNKKYLIIIDGDEYNEFMGLIDSGLVSKTVFDKVYSSSDYVERRLNRGKEVI